MNNTPSIDHEALTALIGQLSELNNMLTEAQQGEQTDISGLTSPFLFGFDIKRDSPGKDYGRYFTYMEIISSTLKEFGIRISNNGYAYISDALKLIIDRNSFDLRLKTDVYPMIAAKHHVRSCTAVEHSIRNAINTAYADNMRRPGINMMGVFDKRPTPKRFLLYVADAVQRSMCETLMRTAG